jgi:hypothetical protein
VLLMLLYRLLKARGVFEHGLIGGGDPLVLGAPAGFFDGHKIRLVMQVLITLVGMVGSLWVLLSGGYSESVENWASGLIGLIAGFWLTPEQEPERARPTRTITSYERPPKITSLRQNAGVNKFLLCRCGMPLFTGLPVRCFLGNCRQIRFSETHQLHPPLNEGALEALRDPLLLASCRRGSYRAGGRRYSGVSPVWGRCPSP